MTFKVISRHKRDGTEAPAVYVDAGRPEDAIRLAREKSGLGRFPIWDFSNCVHVKETRKQPY